MAIPPDPIASGVYGIGRLIAEGVARFLQRVANREIGGSEDPEVIELIKAERKVPEYELLKKYIADRDLRIQIQLGLSLRKLQSRRDRGAAFQSLRSHLRTRFGIRGLHVAELAASGVVTAYLNLLITEEETAADVTTRSESFLRNVDQYTLWVVAETPVDRVLEKVRLRVALGGPGTVAIFAKGEARGKLHKVINQLEHERGDYLIRATTSGDEEVAFVSQAEVWAGVDENEPPKALLRATAHRKR